MLVLQLSRRWHVLRLVVLDSIAIVLDHDFVSVLGKSLRLLEADECFDEFKQSKIRFENASDALLAKLFLKIDGLPLAMFESILSTIRNPSFNTKEITFNGLGDFCSYVASPRDRDLYRRGGGSSAGIPHTILQGMFDILGDENDVSIVVPEFLVACRRGNVRWRIFLCL